MKHSVVFCVYFYISAYPLSRWISHLSAKGIRYPSHAIWEAVAVIWCFDVFIHVPRCPLIDVYADRIHGCGETLAHASHESSYASVRENSHYVEDSWKYELSKVSQLFGSEGIASQHKQVRHVPGMRKQEPGSYNPRQNSWKDCCVLPGIPQVPPLSLYQCWVPTVNLYALSLVGNSTLNRGGGNSRNKGVNNISIPGLFFVPSQQKWAMILDSKRLLVLITWICFSCAIVSWVQYVELLWSILWWELYFALLSISITASQQNSNCVKVHASRAVSS